MINFNISIDPTNAAAATWATGLISAIAAYCTANPVGGTGAGTNTGTTTPTPTPSNNPLL